ncbi:MAG TPA: ATP-binding protein, partial [Candidatus Dormibacteraeota bacterium]|nr:ATP-binding protein [Candidatus Dormibacteraeota bacterium]
MTALQLDSPVIGRDSELSVVDRWLAGPAAGPFALIIEGEAGVGKTTVWRHAIQSAEAAGMRVLRCQAAESELKLGYTGLADLLDSVAAKELDDLPAPQRQALEVALLRTEVPERSLDPRTVATALLSLSRALAATRALVIAVDDVRWLDAPSAQALAFAGRRLDDQVKLIATTRASGELPIGLAEDRVKRLRLGPLSLAALHHLLTSRLGRSFPRLVLVKVHQASRGNPFHALEIGRAL